MIIQLQFVSDRPYCIECRWPGVLPRVGESVSFNTPDAEPEDMVRDEDGSPLPPVNGYVTNVVWFGPSKVRVLVRTA